jgi:hypothetical protein
MYTFRVIHSRQEKIADENAAEQFRGKAIGLPRLFVNAAYLAALRKQQDGQPSNPKTRCIIAKILA